MRTTSLSDLTITYFKQRGYNIEKDISLEGFSGLLRKFDLVVRKGKERHLVKIHDWKRTVGVNMIINVDKASADVGFLKPVIISQKFSGHAKAYANRRGIMLLTKRQIIRGL